MLPHLLAHVGFFVRGGLALRAKTCRYCAGLCAALLLSFSPASIVVRSIPAASAWLVRLLHQVHFEAGSLS